MLKVQQVHFSSSFRSQCVSLVLGLCRARTPGWSRSNKPLSRSDRTPGAAENRRAPPTLYQDRPRPRTETWTRLRTWSWRAAPGPDQLTSCTSWRWAGGSGGPPGPPPWRSSRPAGGTAAWRPRLLSRGLWTRAGPPSSAGRLETGSQRDSVTGGQVCCVNKKTNKKQQKILINLSR